MIDYYVHEVFVKAKRQRAKTRNIYLIVLAVYLIAGIMLFLWYLRLPFQSPTISTVKWIIHPLTITFVIFSFIYLGIPYKRVNKYYKVCVNIETGLREVFVGAFSHEDQSIQQKDGVDFKSLVFIEWNKYKKVFFERKVLVFYEQPFPNLEKDCNYRYITQGNVLVQYEKIDKQEIKDESNSNSNR